MRRDQPFAITQQSLKELLSIGGGIVFASVIGRLSMELVRNSSS